MYKVDGFDGYLIEAKNSFDAYFVQIAAVSRFARSYTHNDLYLSTNYAYRLRAYKQLGPTVKYSIYSNMVNTSTESLFKCLGDSDQSTDSTFYTRGQVQLGNGELVADACLDERVLMEYSCSGEIAIALTNCSRGCFDGACQRP